MKLDTLREVQQWDEAYAFSNLCNKSGSATLERVIFHLDDPMKFIDIESLGVWDLGDIAKAGMLLRRPKIPCTFENEHEMRRVYSLIYDVFRCKKSRFESLGHNVTKTGQKQEQRRRRRRN